MGSLRGERCNGCRVCAVVPSDGQRRFPNRIARTYKQCMVVASFR
jgi:hypothetical protein